jgi:5-formyltetrahydrofolate cyclo-ligase
LTKSEFRKIALKSLKAPNRGQNRLFSHRVAKRVTNILRKERPRSILFYLPLQFEPNLMPILKRLRREKADIFVPFIDSFTFKMVKFRLPLKKSSFGTMESGNSKRIIERVDLVIVPVIGVDSTFRRVGFGKGMYDRFYASLKNRATLIFVQNISCYSREIVTDSYDIKADYYVTPHLSLKIKDLKTDATRNYNRASSYRFCSSTNK